MTLLSRLEVDLTTEEALRQGHSLLRQGTISVDDYKQLQEIVQAFPEDDRMAWLLEGAMAIASDEVLSYIYQEQNPGELIAPSISPVRYSVGRKAKNTEKIPEDHHEDIKSVIDLAVRKAEEAADFDNDAELGEIINATLEDTNES